MSSLDNNNRMPTDRKGSVSSIIFIIKTRFMFVCVCVCPICIKVIGEKKTIENVYISLSAVFIKKVNNFNKTWPKRIEYAESEFRKNFEFVICKFIIVSMNIK